MIDFVLNSDGLSATSGSTPVTITQVLLCDSTHTLIGNTIEDFVGNIVKDEVGLGDNLAIDFSVSAPSADKTISYIQLAANVGGNNTIISESEQVTIVKPGNKLIKLRITARLFTSNDPSTRENRSSKCTFNCITIGLPYATKFRQGVIRLANLTDESHTDNTVFTAADTITKIESYISGSELSVPWDKDASDNPVVGDTTVEKLSIVDDYDTPTHTATLTVDSTSGAIVTDSYITGTAVESTPHTSTSGGSTTITDTTKLVTGSYIASLYSSSVDTSVAQTDAYKLVSSSAVKSYVEDKLDGSNNDYVHKSGAETISGAKTFTGGIVANSTISGSGTLQSYTAGDSSAGQWGYSGSNTLIPTVAAVRGAINAGDAAVTSAFESADNNLQSQIDALNAGQNLADIVDQAANLQAHSLDGLKARGDDVPYSDPAATYPIGDKIQVLHDKTKSDGTVDPTLSGVATVYELVKGTIDTTTYPKDKPSTATGGTGYYWHYIGEYGVDAYTKAQSDSLFIPKTDIVQSITDGDTTKVPSADAVHDYVGTITGNFVTLDTTQTISGAKTFSNGTTTFSNPNDSGASYISVTESGNGTNSSTILNTQYIDNTHWTVAGHSFDRAYGQPNANFTSGLTVFDSQGQHEPIFGTTIRQHNSTHYNLYSSDILLVPDDSVSGIVYPFVEAAHAAGDTTGPGNEENYLERIRIRKNTSTSDSTVHTSYIDLFADNINTVFTSASYRIHSGTSDTEILKINTNDGVYSTSFAGGYIVNGTSYSFGTAGSLAFETTINDVSAANTALPTSLAVKNYVADKISSASEQTLEKLSTINEVGSIGLFVYSEVGNELSYGDEIDGQYLKAVGMSLPMSGQISYKSAALIPACSGTWKLLSLAVRRTAAEPCLVMAQKVHNTYPRPQS